MRLSGIIVLLACLVSVPAYSQESIKDPTFAKWDSCVGYNTQDYADMFGVVSIDGEDVGKAVEDCYDAEAAYRLAHPNLSEASIMHDKDAIAAKWLAYYEGLQKQPKRIAGN